MARADPLACDQIKWHRDNLLSEGEINILLMSPCEVSFCDRSSTCLWAKSKGKTTGGNATVPCEIKITVVSTAMQLLVPPQTL